MKLKVIAFLALVFIFVPAYANDGLVVHFTVTKTVGNNVTTCTSSVLMRLTEASTFTVPGLFQVLFEASARGKDAENLVITLKDLSSGKPVYAGTGALSLKVGKSATLHFRQLAQVTPRYKVFVDTSFGQLLKTVN